MERRQRLERHVEALVHPHGRLVGSEGHNHARDYLIGQLRDAGLVPYPADSYTATYEAAGHRFENVFGLLSGRDGDAAPLLFAAHYDTCGPYPGADDNAAAMAILLEFIAPLREAALKRPALFAFFDAEEPPWYHTPAMGSIRFFEDQCPRPVHCPVVMDLCGHDVPVQGLEDLLFVTGMESDPEFPGVLRDAESGAGLRVLPTLNRYIGDVSDHHVYRVNRKPYLFLSCGRWQHYHQPTDTPEKLNYAKMAAIVDFLRPLAERLDGTALAGPFEGHDPVETELLFLKRHAGPMLELLGLDPKTREDLDQLVGVIMQQFGL